MAAELRATVLVVEDDPALRRMITLFLGAAGYFVREATDGISGLAMVREGPVDLVVLDLMLPGLNGWDVLRRLKRNPATAGIPIVVLTASVNAALAERALRLGALRYLTKPLNTQTLVETVAAALSHGDEGTVDRE